MIIKKNTIVYFFCSLALILTCTLFPSNIYLMNILGVVSIIISLRITSYFKNYSSLFVSFIFVTYSIYSIVVGVYLDPTLRPSYYNQFTDPKLYMSAIESVFIFIFVVFLLINNGKYTSKKLNPLPIENNDYNVVNTIVIILCIFAIGLITITNFSFGENSERATSTALYEYRVVFFIIGMIFSRKKRIWKYVWIAVVTVSCLITFVGGNRANAIPIIIVLVYFYYNNVKPRNIVIFTAVFIFMMICIGTFRATILTNGIDIHVILKRIVDEKFTFDTAYWAFVPSVAAIAVSKTTFFANKIKLFFMQIMYVIFGSKYGEYKLDIYVKNMYNHANGFVAPCYFYFWFGLFGAVIFALIVYLYIREIYKIEITSSNKSKLDIQRAIVCFFIATSPRWFLYSPFNIIRGELIMFISIFITTKVYNAVTKSVYVK